LTDYIAIIYNVSIDSRRATMTELIDEIANELLMTIGPEAVRDLDLKEWDEAEYESMCFDFEITMDEAKEAFPKALAKAKVDAGLRAGY